MTYEHCEHIVGEWLEYADTRVVTLEDLKEAINSYNKYYRLLPHEKEYILKDFANDCVHHQFFQFNYCPICGEKIDWNKIREEDE